MPIEADDPRYKREGHAITQYGARWKNPDPEFTDAFDIRLYPRWDDKVVEVLMARTGGVDITINHDPAVVVRRTVTYGPWEEIQL